MIKRNSGCAIFTLYNPFGDYKSFHTGDELSETYFWPEKVLGELIKYNVSASS
jgi:hypothetical protein